MRISFTLNGEPQDRVVNPFDKATSILAEQCGQESVKTSCAIGRCGACTILVDGKSANACLLIAAKMDGTDVVTAEGLGRRADAIIDRLRENGAIQCGYCAPGLLVSLVTLLERAPVGEKLERQELETVLAGNLCRCSGYTGLRKAILALSS
tara:strand:+ start:71310 stop:71765 length:456 start_codon:yes stop_codon:yes gene_type:complete